MTDLQQNLVYEGEWQNNVQNGEGRLIHDDKVLYEGNWVNGKKSGDGTINFNDKKYRGMFLDNKQPSMGILTLGHGYETEVTLQDQKFIPKLNCI